VKRAATGANGAGFYRPELDGLRFVAFLAVFIHHAVPTFSVPSLARRWPFVGELVTAATHAGAYGVELFFVLSSYLITELLLREREVTGVLDARSFYIRRALRIWPLYYLFLFVSAVVLPRFFPDQSLGARYILAFSLLLGNWACACWGFPASSAAPLWSVSVEEQFYVAWPLVVRKMGEASLLRVCAGAIVVAVIGRSALVLARAHDPALWTSTFAHLDSIACGAIVCILLRKKVRRITRLRAALLVAVCPVTWLVGALLEGTGKATWPYALVAFPLLAAGSSCLLVATVLRGPEGILTNRVFVFLGRISYGLYVVHSLGLAIAEHVPIQLVGIALVGVRALVGLAITIGMAVLSYRFIERPFLRLKERFAHVISRPET
jgi:peptidoglycan/LPS O-acetylase OafA/YrhL